MLHIFLLFIIAVTPPDKNQTKSFQDYFLNDEDNRLRSFQARDLCLVVLSFPGQCKD